METPADLVDLKRLNDITSVSAHLHDVLAQERAVEMELEQRLLRRKDMETELLSLVATISEVLQLGHSESDALTSTVRTAAEKAQQVSHRVRRLDTAQTNLMASISKIGVILECSSCVSGVQGALDGGDFEAAAQHISTYQALDLDTTDLPPGSTAAVHGKVIAEARTRLLMVVREKLKETMTAKDTAELTRFLKLYKPLDMPDEGLSAALTAMRSGTEVVAEKELQDLKARISVDPANSNFLQTLSVTLRAMFRAVLEYEPLVADVFGKAYVVALVQDVMKQMDEKVPPILETFVSVRQLDALAASVNARSGTAQVDAVAIDLALNELRGLMACGAEFVAFLLKTVAAAVTPRPVPREVTEALRTGRYARSVHALQAAYVSLEGFYLERCISKAVELDTVLPGAMMSSMLDDGFFVLKQSATRALSTGSVQSFVSVLAIVCSQLRGPFTAALSARLAEVPAAILRSLASEGEGSDGALNVADDIETVAAPLNNIAQSISYVNKMHEAIETQAMQRFTGASDAEAIRSALEELPQASSTLRDTCTRTCDGVADVLIQRLLEPSFTTLSTTPFQLSDAKYSALEAEDGWTRPVCRSLQHYLGVLVTGLSPEASQDVSRSVLSRLLFRIEAVLSTKKFNMLGGLLLDRDIRSLTAGLAEVTKQPVRERFARLTQIVELLTIESVEEVATLKSDETVTWRLSAAEVKSVLSWRVDLDRAAIANLVL